MRHIKLLIWAMLGFCLGGYSVWASASNVIWSSRDSVVVRTATGEVKAVPGVRVLLDNMADGAGGVTARASQPVAVNGVKAELALSKSVPKASVATAGRVAARALGVVGVAMLAYDAYGLLWGEDGWLVPAESDGAPESNRYWWRGSGTSCVTAADKCSYGYVEAIVESQIQAAYGSTGWSWTGNWVKGAYASQYGGYRWTRNFTTTIGGFNYATIYSSANPDAPTQTRAATDAEIEAALAAALAANPQAATSVLDKGISVGYVPVTDPLQVTGPSSLQGPKTTSTTSSPAGVTTTISNTTYNMHYDGDTVSITPTTVTTTTSPDGTQETTTTTSDPDGESSSDGDDPPTLCEEHPDASACQELGDPEDEDELEEDERDIDFDQELSAAGSCPSDVALALHFDNPGLSWKPVCDFASGMRYVVLTAAWLSAAVFVFFVGGRAVA
ncbi:hypothetical protein GPA19_17875 [Azoarcus indigens]|nr:IgG-binding virulence factor TspB family protein [Azoarcus indigens]NMG66811.1 hypothetical protein [Azoarcus indigens]